MKKINIGFFGTRGLGNYGGFETIAQKLHENLDGNYFNFLVSKECEQENKYEISSVDQKTSIISQKHTFIKKYSKELDNIVNEGKIITECYRNNPWDIDVIFQCGSTPGLSMREINDKGPLLLWNPDGIEWKRAKFPKYAQAILYYSTLRGIKNSHAITVDSKAIGKYLSKMIKDKPVYYLPSGTDIVEEKDVDISYLKDYGLEKENYYIMVGRSVPENHILEILEYFLEAETKKKLMVVCNFGKDDYSLKSLNVIENNKDKIIYKGPIYDQKILKSIRYYAFAYIHGHSVGGTNPSLLEALGAGNPCICYDVEYNKEVAQDVGKYFENKDDFKKSIKEMETIDEFYKKKIKGKAKKIIEENFTWEYISEVHEAIVISNLIELQKISNDFLEEWLKTKKFKEKILKNNFNKIEAKNEDTAL